jgi:signal transduction histidine kinase
MPTEDWIAVLTAIGVVGLGTALPAAVVVGAVQPEGGIWLVGMAALFGGGALCARRRPGELAARRYLFLGTTAIVWFAAGLGLAIAHRRLGDGSWLVLPNTLMLMLDLALPAAIVGVAATYPEGATQRPYARRLTRAALVLAALVPVVLLLSRPTLLPTLVFGWTADYTGPAPAVASPLHLGALDFLSGPATFYARAALGLLVVLAVLLLLLRYRRSAPEQRRRLVWPLVAFALAALQPLGNGLVSLGLLPQRAVSVPIVLAIVAVAAGLAIGLLRPALFDLGHAVRRTLAYLALWAAIGAAYVGIAAAAGVAAGGEGLQVAVAIAIAVTLLAGPLRRGLARRAARWAYGERVSGPEVLRRLGDALEHTLESEELARTLAATIREGLGVTWVRLELDDGFSAAAGPVPRHGRADAGHGRVPLAYGAQHLGVLEVAAATPPVDRVVLGNLARQAALALGNARLAAELRTRAEQLAASRTRIVEAQETARRRLERDIHDGVQQELVALIAKIGLARRQVEHDPDALASTLEDLQGEVRQALAELRELASGIHSSVLADRGVVEAISSRAARLPLEVAIECPPELRARRFPEPVEGAAYFVVCEGFANALKHAAAERVTVRLQAEPRSLLLEVGDDGCGFDPAAARDGTGLSGLADRVEALGGSFRVDSSPGAGTLLRAMLPVLAAAAPPVPPAAAAPTPPVPAGEGADA